MCSLQPHSLTSAKQQRDVGTQNNALSPGKTAAFSKSAATDSVPLTKYSAVQSHYFQDLLLAPIMHSTDDS